MRVTGRSRLWPEPCCRLRQDSGRQPQQRQRPEPVPSPDSPFGHGVAMPTMLRGIKAVPFGQRPPHGAGDDQVPGERPAGAEGKGPPRRCRAGQR